MRLDSANIGASGYPLASRKHNFVAIIEKAARRRLFQCFLAETVGLILIAKTRMDIGFQYSEQNASPQKSPQK